MRVSWVMLVLMAASVVAGCQESSGQGCPGSFERVDGVCVLAGDDGGGDAAETSEPEGGAAEPDGAPGDGGEQPKGDAGADGSEFDEDVDDDGVADEEDNCPDKPNDNQADFDGDGIGDACDDDTDGDAVANAKDLCPTGATEGEDTDGDGCKDEGEDDDDDDDGLLDEEDFCPLVSASVESDPDGDGCPAAEDACPTGGHTGTDSDGDGCLNIEDPAPQDAESPGAPLILHVDAAANIGGADGRTWQAAFPFLADAIREGNEALSDGDVTGVELWIAGGVYYPDDSVAGSTAGDPSASFVPRSGTKLLGGFRRDEDGTWLRDFEVATVLSGDIDHETQPDGDVSNVPIAERNGEALGVRGTGACNLVGGSEFDEDVYLDGLVLEGASNNGGDCGEGAAVVLTEGGARVSRTVVRANATMAGLASRDATLVDVELRDNVLSGAIIGNTLRAHGLKVIENRGSPYTVSVTARVAVMNAVFAGNTASATGYPTVIVSEAELCLVAHTTFLENDDPTGAQRPLVAPECTMASSIVASTGDQDVEGFTAGGEQVLERVSFQNATNDSTVEGLVDWPDLTGADDVFTAPELDDEDLRLKATEHNFAIDAGPGRAVRCPSGSGTQSWSRMHLSDGRPLCADGFLAVDADGNPRQQGDAVDLGAYEVAR